MDPQKPPKTPQEHACEFLSLCADATSTLKPWKSHLLAHVMPSVVSHCEKPIAMKTGISHFLGQCQYESGNFQYRTEILNYSSKERILAIFSSHHFAKKGALDVEDCVKNPQNLGNTVYSDRLGNGNFKSGDGYRYRGRGFIQVTGRETYTQLQKYLQEHKIAGDVVNCPDQVADNFPVLSAVFYFDKRSIWPLTQTINAEAIANVTQKINGSAKVGLQERSVNTHHFASLLGL